MIYKMPYPVWSRVFEYFELLPESAVPYIDMELCSDTSYEPMEEYFKHEFGLVYTGEWESFKDDFGDSIDDAELYHYLVTDSRKFTLFLS